jgi:hypothetical protein
MEKLQAPPDTRDGAAASPRAAGAVHSFLKPTDLPGYLGRLGIYEVRRVIGQGGMGIVLEALDPLLKRTVAIKMLSPWRVLDEETKARFLREAQSAAALQHENVVAIHAVDLLDNMPFLVLEYVPGESLADRFSREGKLPLDEVVRLGTQVARGLAAAHAKGLVHRDIKPANILLVEVTGRAKIADFGLAKTTGEDAITMEGTLLGTPEFMSPEQAAGKEASERSDLFSLGSVLYVAATGVSPFRHPSLLGTLEQVRTCQPRPLQQVDPNLPGWFCELIHRLLALEPAERPSSAAEVAEILERRSSPGVIAAPQGAAKPQELPRRWWIMAAVALAALLLAIPAGIWLRGKLRENAVRKKHNDRQPQAPPAIQTGFTINGRAGSFDTLAAALEAAREDEVIEVHGNGPFLTPPLTIKEKRLTIRAAAGTQPVLLMETPGVRASQPFLHTDSDLRLEGLEIRWSVDVPPGRSEAEMLARCNIVSTHGRLTLAHCRIVGDRFNGCVGGSCRELVLRHCHLIAKEGVGLIWVSESGGKLDVEGCVLENRIGVSMVITGIAAGDAPPQVRLSHCTFSAERSLQLLIESLPRQPLPVVADHTIFDSEFLFPMFLQRQPRPKSLSKTDDPVDVLRTSIRWSEKGNVHRRGMHYIAKPQGAAKPGAVTPANLHGLDHWLELWKLAGTASIEGEIRFQDRPESGKSGPLVLKEVGKASGQVPAEVGASADQLGPQK